MKALLFLLAITFAAAGCGESEPPETAASGPAAASAPAAAAEPVVLHDGFVDRRVGSGVDFVNHSGRPGVKEWIHESKGGSALVLDYDRDGRMDLYFVDGNVCVVDDEGRVRDRTAEPAAGNRLYRNLGGWKFEDVTERAGVGDRAWGFGGTVGDYDGDGDTDIYVCNWGENRLYRNEGDGTFTDVAAAAGVAGGTSWYSTGATFLDADGDGDLDLYVSNYDDIAAVMKELGGKGLRGRFCGIPVYVGPKGTPAARDQLFRNEGDGTFTEVTDSALLGQEARYSFTPVVSDLDRDGDPDLYVTEDSVPNTLWVNDGKGVFRDRGAAAGVAKNALAAEQAGMGNDSADYDQDGWPDLFTTNFSFDMNTLYRNLTGELGQLYFEDVSERSGLSTGDFEKTCWGTKFADLDRDGYLDLFIAAGHVYPEVDRVVREHGATYRQRPSLWRNSGPPDFRFEDVSVAVGGPEMEVPRVTRGACFADLDDDGDVDVVLYGLNGPPVLFENRIPATGGFFQLALVGRPPNRDALGAKVTLVAAGGRIRQLQEMRVGASFLGTNDPRLHWGLGAAKRVDRLEVEWPDGTKQAFEDLEANHLFRLVEGGKIETVR